MTYETPRDSAGTKLCGWCGDAIKQSGVGRSKDYCTRLCRERAYRRRRDERLIAEALADAQSISSTRETADSSTEETEVPVSPVDESAVREEQPAPAPPPPRRPERPAYEVFRGLPKGLW
ncbi:hypothetical protein [Streptomyces decoyicus]